MGTAVSSAETLEVFCIKVRSVRCEGYIEATLSA